MFSSNKNEAIINKNEAIVKLIDSIKQNKTFSAYPNCDFTLYPFSNEKGFSSIIQQLNQIDSKKSDKIKVALLLGESHILSMLSPLSQLVDVIILADINQKLHNHIQHMLNCLHQAETIEEFYEFYKKDNPIPVVTYPSLTLTTLDFVDHLRYSAKNLVGENYFLSNEESFQCNKRLAKQLHIIPIHLDLNDIQQCRALVALIRQYHGDLSLCNFTNIHDYIPKNVLTKSASVLLEYSAIPKVICSYGASDHSIPELYLQAQLTDLNGYKKNILQSSVEEGEQIPLITQHNLSLFSNDQNQVFDNATQNTDRELRSKHNLFDCSSGCIIL